MIKTSLIIVRHGETEWNTAGIRQGHLDSALTGRGIAQARALAKRLANETFAALYASDLGRAVQTAAIIGCATGHPTVTDARLRERHLGIFQGLSAVQIKERFPEEYRLHRTLGPDYVIPEGESMRQQVERNVGCLTEIARRHPGKTVVVVTHGGVLSGFFRHTLFIPLEAPRRFEFVNAGLNVFVYEGDTWFLQTWGDLGHLGAAHDEGAKPKEG
ncbi:MAG TPA: histidine phosphatase family protein [Candidatus Eisenbacteria bacterium]|nr:histidine phosphatase family protein [Candidatus Eisenbacteria bacterium]